MSESRLSEQHIIAWLSDETNLDKTTQGVEVIKEALNGHAADIDFDVQPDLVRGVIWATEEEAKEIGKIGLRAFSDLVPRPRIELEVAILKVPPLLPGEEAVC